MVRMVGIVLIMNERLFITKGFNCILLNEENEKIRGDFFVTLP